MSVFINRFSIFSRVYLVIFSRVLLNFNTSGILGLLAIFGFEVNDASLDIFHIWFN